MVVVPVVSALAKLENLNANHNTMTKKSRRKSVVSALAKLENLNANHNAHRIH